MSPLAWAAAGAVGGLAATLVLVRNGLFPARLVRGGPTGELGDGQQSESGDAAVRVRLWYDDLKLIRDDIQGLHVLRTDLQRVGDLLERLLEEAMAFQPPRVDPSPESSRRYERPAPPEPRGLPRDAVRETVRYTQPVQGSTWRQAERDAGLDVRHDESAGGSDPNLSPHPSSLGGPAPALAPYAPAGAPSPDAVKVEAKDDAIVPSERHPPEAWLERRGGDGEVWLNSRVALTDPALQRWSTFFDWERREAGGRYQAVRPALVSWSGSTGTVLRKGMARPL